MHVVVEPLEKRVLLNGSVVARLPDGSRLLENGASLTRVYADGSLDLAFGAGGTATIPIEGAELGPVAVQRDGKFLVGGDVNPNPASASLFVSGIELLLARLNPDGSLDRSFGDAGVVVTDVAGHDDDACATIVVQPDGKILVGGWGYNGHGDPGMMWASSSALFAMAGSASADVASR